MNKLPNISDIDVVTKAQVLLEALPYIQRFRGSVFVVKYGGSFMDDPVVLARVATDLVFLASVGIHVTLVHGGGKDISRAMEEAGLKPVFHNGLRVTDEHAIKVVEKTLDEEINLGICRVIESKEGRPVGIAGSSVFTCARLERDEDNKPVNFGFVGEINTVNSTLIKKALAGGRIPVISPTARDKKGQIYNTNADVAAFHVARSVGARRLVYLCDVPGLLRDPDDPDSLISTLPVSEVDSLKRNGVIAKGMLPKVDSAARALQNDVHRVHLIDGLMPHSILLEIFTDKGIGTEIVSG